MERILISQGFKSSESDRCLFTKSVGEDIIILLLYVDDGLVVTTKIELAEEFLEKLEKLVKITSTFEVTSFLGMELSQNNNGISLSQVGYVDKLISKFRMEQATSAPTPISQGWEIGESGELKNKQLYQELVGSLRYLNCVSRPDISFVLSRLSSGVEKPTNAHWELGKRVLRYLKGTREWKLLLPNSGGSEVQCYTDADYAGDAKRRSTSGLLGFVGKALVVWNSKQVETFR